LGPVNHFSFDERFIERHLERLDTETRG